MEFLKLEWLFAKQGAFKNFLIKWQLSIQVVETIILQPTGSGKVQFASSKNWELSASFILAIQMYFIYSVLPIPSAFEQFFSLYIGTLSFNLGHMLIPIFWPFFPIILVLFLFARIILISYLIIQLLYLLVCFILTYYHLFFKWCCL